MITCTGLWLTCFVILFLYTRLLSFPRLLLTGLLLLRSKSYMEFCASRKRLALTESDFLETWKFRFFFTLLSLFRVLFNCDCGETASWIDDNMHWALIDFCDTLFVYKTIEFSAVALAWLATSALKKLHAILCLKETLGFDSLIFWRLNNSDFLDFAVSFPCFIQLRLWWNCASWIDHNMHWALIDLFCDNLFVYNTIEFSSVALNWLATSAFKNWYAILCLRKRLALTESL